jgi:cell division protein FtsZ
MTMPGLINLDFADIRTVMGEMGKAMMGAGEAEGDGRAIKAAESAIANPLLDDVSLRGARGVLINITGGNDMTLYEVDESANRIREEVDADANIIFGSTFDETIQGRIRVSIFATGINGHHASAQPQPNRVRVLDERARRPAPAPTEIVSDDDEPEEIFGLGPKLEDKPDVKTASLPDPTPVREPVPEPAPERVVEPAAERSPEPVKEPIETPAPKPIVAQAAPVSDPEPAPAPTPAATPTPIVAETKVEPAPAPSPAPTLVSTPAPVETPPAAQTMAPEPAPAPMPIFASPPKEETRKDPVFTSASAEPAQAQSTPAQAEPIQTVPPHAGPASVAEAAPAPTLVREVPKPETAEASDGKPKARARSRLLGLLIDNSVSDEDRAAPAEAKSAPRIIETPAAQQAPNQVETPRAMEAAQPAPLAAGSGLDREEKEEAELLEIPAFLRRQAN